MASAVFPTPFLPGFRLLRGDSVNLQLQNTHNSTQDAVTAHAGGTRAAAFAITAAYTNVTTVGTTADSLVLPSCSASLGQEFFVSNNGANAMTVYAAGSDTINGTAGATGVSVPAGVLTSFRSVSTTKWLTGLGASSSGGAGTFTSLTDSGTLTFTTAASGVVLKQGANGLVGTFVANGASAVTVSNTNVAISDAIIISLNTVGGTVGAVPAIKTITAGTGFTVAATASDTSTYNYAIVKNAA